MEEIDFTWKMDYLLIPTIVHHACKLLLIDTKSESFLPQKFFAIRYTNILPMDLYDILFADKVFSLESFSLYRYGIPILLCT